MRVALLTNFIPPYRVPFYEALAREVGQLRILISTPMESNRHWEPEWGQLDVVLQRALTLKRKWRGPGFSEPSEIHVPYDTLAQLRKYRPDLVLTGQMGARSLQAGMYATLTHTPLVLWAMLSDRLDAQWGTARKLVRRWLARTAHSIVVNGESGARYFHRLGVPDDKLFRLHQPVDMRALLALPWERTSTASVHLLHVGSLSERKGVHLLLPALRSWAQRHPERTLRVTFVGDGPLRSMLDDAFPANLHVSAAGAVPYEHLPRWYAQGDVLLFPSLGDEWGLVVNEALAAGVPVLGSVYSQAVEELVQDGVNGWVFEPDSSAHIERALDRVFDTGPQQLDDMRRTARAGISHYTPAAAAAQLAKHLQQIAGKLL